MTPNDKAKQKALQQIMKDLDGIHGQSIMQRLKPKHAIVEESISVQPKGQNPESDAMPMPVPGAEAKSDMDDDDKQRLLQLYSNLK